MILLATLAMFDVQLIAIYDTTFFFFMFRFQRNKRCWFKLNLDANILAYLVPNLCAHNMIVSPTFERPYPYEASTYDRH